MKNLGNVFILGDSYSTFEGYIPEGYAIYFYDGHSGTDVTKVDETWWKILLNETGSRLVLNNSASGSTVARRGYGGCDATSTCFVHRIDELCENGFFKNNKIDTVFVFGGTNDSWASNDKTGIEYKLGEPKFSGITSDDLFATVPAFCYLFGKLKAELPDAEIIMLINGDHTRYDIVNGMKAAAEHYNIKYVDIRNLNVIDGHPTVSGMRYIVDKIEESGVLS